MNFGAPLALLFLLAIPLLHKSGFIDYLVKPNKSSSSGSDGSVKSKPQPVVYSGSPDNFPLTILHTNDVHARFVSFNQMGRPCEEKDTKANECWGGAARRQTAMKKFLEEDVNVLKLDAGDQFQGTLWYTALKWKPIAEYMNAIRYDAMAFGNHAFDDGVEVLEPFVRNLSIPIVNSNIDDNGSPLKDLYKRYIIKEMGNEKIGIVGCTTKDTPKLANPDPLLEFRDEILAVQESVDQLVQSGINKIIVLSHAGYVLDQEICKRVKNADIVVGGHSHTFLWPNNTNPPSTEASEGPYPHPFDNGQHKCLVVQNYAYGKYLGRLKVTFDAEGNLKHWEGSPVLLDNKFAEDPEIAAILEPHKVQLEHFQKTVVAKTAVELNSARPRKVCRRQECSLGNLLADGALHVYVKHQLQRPDKETSGWTTAAIAVWPGGLIRGFFAPVGAEIRLEDLYTIMPYQNTIDKITVPGLTLKKAFEHAVSEWKPQEPEGKFLQVSGVKVTYDLSQPDGQRVQKILVRCADCAIPRYEALNYEKIYGVVIPSYVAEGGDGFTMFRDDKRSSDKSGLLDVDAIMDYLKANCPIVVGEEMRIEMNGG